MLCKSCTGFSNNTIIIEKKLLKFQLCLSHCYMELMSTCESAAVC